ncbi:uncharacterized protein [Amphiura filiformis]|uniref:uncharacterized protein n=1 Tax=Amphiura filiformis TaxID=82378 RepID=UPI003B2120E3
MDRSRVLFCLLLVLISAVNISTQPVTVTMLISREKPRTGDAFSLQCRVSGYNLTTDIVTIGKVNPLTRFPTTLASSEGDIAHNSPHLTSSWSTNPTALIMFLNGAMASDMGDYRCTVLRASATLTEETYHLDLLHIPSQTFPVCNSEPSQQVYYEGDIVRFVCFSDLGNPSVNLTWTRSDGGVVPQTTVTNELDSVVTRITAILTLNDDRVSFNCTSRSAEFPDYLEDCLITVLSVIPRRSAIQPPSTPSPTTDNQSSNQVTQCSNCLKQVIVIAVLGILVAIIIGLLSVIVCLCFKVKSLGKTPKEKSPKSQTLDNLDDHQYETRMQNEPYADLQKESMDNATYESV